MHQIKPKTIMSRSLSSLTCFTRTLESDVIAKIDARVAEMHLQKRRSASQADASGLSQRNHTGSVSRFL